MCVFIRIHKHDNNHFTVTQWEHNDTYNISFHGIWQHQILRILIHEHDKTMMSPDILDVLCVTEKI